MVITLWPTKFGLWRWLSCVDECSRSSTNILLDFCSTFLPLRVWNLSAMVDLLSAIEVKVCVQSLVSRSNLTANTMYLIPIFPTPLIADSRKQSMGQWSSQLRCQRSLTGAVRHVCSARSASSSISTSAQVSWHTFGQGSPTPTPSLTHHVIMPLPQFQSPISAFV